MMKMGLWTSAAAFALAGFAFAPGFATATELTVKIDNFTFNPAKLTVKVGDTVTWTNGDDIPHTVRATTGAFKSNALDTGDHFTFTFDKAGSYAYFCSLHPHMTGSVVVEAAGGAKTTP